MKLLPLLLIIFSIAVHAADECVFDENAYIKFIDQYSKENKNAKIGPDGKTLSIKRGSEEIIVTGGGCVHLGALIELSTRRELTEQQFLQKTLTLSIEFGDWLINTRALKDSIETGRFQIIDGIYYVEVDAMTLFSATYDKHGKIFVDFYIN